MPERLVKLIPLEPYFLGGERIFEKGDGNKHYFIRSLDTPSQTTLLGALRYAGIEKPSPEFVLSEKDKGNIGGESFRLDCPERNDFGSINRISPLYLLNEDGFWIPTPFDHEQACSFHRELAVYTRFEKYSDPIPTAQGLRRFPAGYNAKDGVTGSWLCLGDRRVRSGLFEPVTRVGIGRNSTDKAFFKKEYKRLKEGFCFAFLADVAADFAHHQRVVYLGQGKSPFQIEIIENSEKPCIPADLLRKGMAYAQSDIYYTGDLQALYNDCQFVCVKIRAHRIFKADYRSRTGSRAVQLVQAGSVFWPNDAEDFAKKIHSPHAAIAGFNQILIGGNA